MVGSQETFRSLLQSVVEVARAIFGATASSIFLLDEETDELVFEAIAGYGADDAHRAALPVEHGHRRLGARHAAAARDRGRDRGSALRQGLRRDDRLRPEGPDGRAAALRRAGARRARGARPAAAHAVLARRRWICSGCSRTRRRSRSTSCAVPAGRRRCSRRAAKALDVRRTTGGDARGLEEERRAAGAADAQALEEILQKQRGRLGRPRKRRCFATTMSRLSARRCSRRCSRSSARRCWRRARPIWACPSTSGLGSSTASAGVLALTSSTFWPREAVRLDVLVPCCRVCSRLPYLFLLSCMPVPSS